MTWLVTGGAGYIGSHVVRHFLAAGESVTVLDNLSSGHRRYIPESVKFVHGDIRDDLAVRASLEGDVSGVIHLAGYKYAGESVSHPDVTYSNNVLGTQVLLDGMVNRDVRNMVFSSSAAVFGTPTAELVTEESPVMPESPYGETKLIGEWLVRDYVKAFGLNATSLRYFNVVGSGFQGLADTSPHNLFPLLISALRDGRIPHINGDDFETKDGTCVRDYIHVDDLARCHVSAALRLVKGVELRPVYNLGSGFGTTVMEIMKAASKVTGVHFVPEIRDRRSGDPARIVASGDKAERDIEWANRHSIESMFASAWKADEEARLAALSE